MAVALRFEMKKPGVRWVTAALDIASAGSGGWVGGDYPRRPKS